MAVYILNASLNTNIQVYGMHVCILALPPPLSLPLSASLSQDLASEELRTWVAAATGAMHEYLILYVPRGDANIKQSSFSISSSVYSDSRRHVHVYMHTYMPTYSSTCMRTYAYAHRQTPPTHTHIHTRTHTHTHTHTHFFITLYHRCERLLEKLSADLKIERPDSIVVCSLKAADDFEGSKEDGGWVVAGCLRVWKGWWLGY